MTTLEGGGATFRIRSSLIDAGRDQAGSNEDALEFTLTECQPCESAKG